MTIVEKYTALLKSNISDPMSNINKNAPQAFVDKVLKKLPESISIVSNDIRKDYVGKLYYLAVANIGIANDFEYTNPNEPGSSIELLRNEVIRTSVEFLSKELEDSYPDFATAIEEACSYIYEEHKMIRDVRNYMDDLLTSNEYNLMIGNCLKELFEYVYNISPLLDHKDVDPSRRAMAHQLSKRLSTEAFGSSVVKSKLEDILDYKMKEETN